MIHGLLIAIGHHLWQGLLALQLTFAGLSLLAAQVDKSVFPQYIAASASMITAIAVLITARSNGKKIDTAQQLSIHNSGKLDVVKEKVEAVHEGVEKVHAEQQTDNGMNLGATAAAILSQGIAAKPPEDRTGTDNKHQKDMRDNDPSGVVAADQAAAAVRDETGDKPQVKL